MFNPYDLFNYLVNGFLLYLKMKLKILFCIFISYSYRGQWIGIQKKWEKHSKKS